MLIPRYSRISAFPFIAWQSGLPTIRWSTTGEVPVVREQRKLAAVLAAQLVGYSLTAKGISIPISRSML